MAMPTPHPHDAPLGVPNLDDCDRETVAQYGHWFRLLARYCEYIADAKSERASGYIHRAEILENQAEAIYTRLPEWARW